MTTPAGAPAPQRKSAATGRRQKHKQRNEPRASKPIAPVLPRPSKALTAALGAALAALTLVVYAQVYRNGFVAYDDDKYVYLNDALKQGLTASGVAWAFTTFYCANWHPLTWLSHMLDYRLFGLNAGAHHLVNLGFHLASVLLLFAAFTRMTGRAGRSAIVAGIFAIHPLHVESVAWVAERKDVLSTFLGMVTLLFYIRFARKPSALRYAAVVVSFALALLAKPMLVTLPFVFLLLDVWPLARLPWPPNWGKARRLAMEKAPLLAMVAAACAVTFVAQRSFGAVQPLSNLAFRERVANAFVGYVSYIGKALWPASLGVLYPIHPVSAASAIAAAAVLAAATFASFAWGARRPYLPVGWLWYLGMLVPVIGIVQVGEQFIADRYTYLPLVGLSFAVVWLAADAVEGRQGLKRAAGAAAFAALILFAAAAYRQTAYWRSSRTLFEHTLAVTGVNPFMHNNLGVAFAQEGKVDEAAAQYQAAAADCPTYAGVHNNLGLLYAQHGRTPEAIAEYEKATAMDPRFAEGYRNLGVLLSREGRFDEALSHYKKALEIDPHYAEAGANLGHELLRRGQFDEACRRLEEAIAGLPGSSDARADLGTALAAQGKYQDAIAPLEEALRIDPDKTQWHNNLGFVLQHVGRRAEAMSHYAQALKLDPNSIDAHYNMGRALAEEGRSSEAAGEFSRVLRLYPGHAGAREALAKLQGAR